MYGSDLVGEELVCLEEVMEVGPGDASELGCAVDWVDRGEVFFEAAVHDVDGVVGAFAAGDCRVASASALAPRNDRFCFGVYIECPISGHAGRGDAVKHIDAVLDRSEEVSR